MVNFHRNNRSFDDNIEDSYECYGNNKCEFIHGCSNNDNDIIFARLGAGYTIFDNYYNELRQAFEKSATMSQRYHNII